MYVGVERQMFRLGIKFPGGPPLAYPQTMAMSAKPKKDKRECDAPAGLQNPPLIPLAPSTCQM